MKFSVFALFCTFILSLNTALAHDKHCEDTDLGAAMVQMKKTDKKLKKAVRSENFEQVAKLAGKLKRLVNDNQDHIPLKYKGKVQEFESKKAEYREHFQKMNQLLDQLIEKANSESEDELESLIEQLGKNKKQAHKSFKKDCD